MYPRIARISIVLILTAWSSARAVTVIDYPSALNLGYQFLSPRPESEYMAPETGLILRFAVADPSALTNLETFIQVQGSQSGTHKGQTRIASDGVTILFTPDQAFTQREQVTGKLAPLWSVRATHTVGPLDYRFFVSCSMIQVLTAGSIDLPAQGSNAAHGPGVDLETVAQTHTVQSAAEPIIPHSGQAYIMENGVSVPSNFPHILVRTYDNPDENLIFMDNRTTGSNSYNVIFDNTGLPVWYWQTNDERRDMKVQRNGLLTMLACDGGMRFIGLDNHYQQGGRVPGRPGVYHG
jgi:hypothetical protein